MASLQHQSSLGSVSDLLPRVSLTLQEYQTAEALFNRLLQHYGIEHTTKRRYKPATLIQATFGYVKSKDAFLDYFFLSLYGNLCVRKESAFIPNVSQALSYLEDFSSWDAKGTNDLAAAIEEFAEHLVVNFFYPLRASSSRTPQPTPASLSALQASTPSGSVQRLSVLRKSCLIRDHHRCVVSRKFDRGEAKRRFKQHGEASADDDDGNHLKNETSDQLSFLEVAHILPHSLTSISTEGLELSDSKKNVLQILTMFDPEIKHLINGPKIDTPLNALTLTRDFHQLFGEFEIYFESTEVPYQYKIDSTEQRAFLRDPLFPVTRTLHLSPGRSIDPPSPRLLAVHRAVALILKLSGAGEYIEKILQDIEELRVEEDGSTNLDQFVRLRLAAWPA